jgi:hypothetical protein
MVMGRAFIELRDLNYPGSTYTLTYELASNHLTNLLPGGQASTLRATEKLP